MQLLNNTVILNRFSYHRLTFNTLKLYNIPCFVNIYLFISSYCSRLWAQTNHN